MKIIQPDFWVRSFTLLGRRWFATYYDFIPSEYRVFRQGGDRGYGFRLGRLTVGTVPARS